MKASQSQLPQHEDQQCDDNFEFTAKGYSYHLNCFMCSRLMVKARRMHPCAHTLCHQCMQKNQSSKKDAKHCPLCLEPIKTVQPDYLVSQLVGQLEVKCRSDGCVWTGELENYKKFHSGKCVLKDGGLQKWLTTLKASTNVDKAKLEKKQRYDDNGLPIQYLCHQRQEMQPFQSEEQKSIVKKSFKNQDIISKQPPMVTDQQ